MSFEVAMEMNNGRWKRYPAYRDSGVEWIGEVPDVWETWKVTHGFQKLGSGTTPKSDDPQYYNDIIPWVTTSELRETVITDTKSKLSEKAMIDYSSLRIYPPETLLFAMYGATIGRMGILGIPATVNQACCAFIGSKFLDSKFTFYWLWMRRPILIALSVGGGQPNLSQDDLRKIRIPAPSLPEQRAIASFLDRETRRIDILIEMKERQIELLQEKRAALISHVVTKGLDPDVKMKDSRVEWIRMIPEHWTLLPLKRNWQVTDCKHKTVSFIDEGIPVASIGEVKSIDVNLVNAKMTTYEEYEELIEGGRKPKRGDIIYSRNATVGAAGFVNTDVDFCMGQDVCLISSKINNQRFLIHQLRSPVVINQLESLQVGATFKRINVDQIKNFFVTCPPPKEQEVIASYCDKISHRADILSTKVRESISKLREYRIALISAAVTGKIDVRQEVMT